MSFHTRSVLIGELVISQDPKDVLVVYGLGSCVAVCFYDPKAKIGGILHALLPTAQKHSSQAGQPHKFVDQGIPYLLSEMLRHGASKQRLQVVLCGGAQILSGPSMEANLNIGERNIQAAKIALKKTRLHIKASALGGTTGRTIKFYINNGCITQRRFGETETLLTRCK